MKKPGKRTKQYIILIIVCVAIALWVVFGRRSPKPPQYEIIDLGTFGKSSIEPVAINDFGQITGYFKDPNGVDRSFIYDDSNGFKEIGSLGGNANARDINNKGLIAGQFFDANDNEHLFIWVPEEGIKELSYGEIGNSQSFGKINNKSQVVGSFKNPDSTLEAFIWDKETGYKLLGTLGGKTSFATAINDKGQVVGQSETAEGEFHAFIWDDANGMTDLGTLGGNYSSAWSINNRGQIYGTSKKSGSDYFHVIWDMKKQINKLDMFPKDAYAHSSNDHGQLIGSYFDKRILWPSLKTSSYKCPFIWSQQNGFIDLSYIVVNSTNRKSKEDLFVIDINNKGQILGTAQIDRQPHIFILKPKAKP